MDIDRYCIQEMSIKNALKALDDSSNKTLFIVDDKKKLVGAFTDGDVRRWILKNGSIDESIYEIMTSPCIFLYEGNTSYAYSLMKEHIIDTIPVVNQNNEIVELLFFMDFFNNNRPSIPKKLDADIVINAGGKGSRLKPITLVIPKPLIPIGDTSIIERIMMKFKEYGCSHFTIIINYKKELIKAYFKDIDIGATINFVDEIKPLGTIGGLHSQREEITRTFFLSNCDIMIEADYTNILKFHHEEKNKITVVASLKNNKVPYGVITLDDNGRVIKVQEKPEYDFLANTGLYVIEPDVLDHIPENEFFHTTDLINACIDKNEKVGIYPISDDCWLDMGQFKDMGIMFEHLNVK